MTVRLVVTKSEYSSPNPEQVTEDACHRQQTHVGDRPPHVTNTESHCFQEYVEMSNQQVSDFAACAKEANK